MKLHEVLEQLNGNTELWFRPVSWKGYGEAFVLNHHRYVCLVPDSNGGCVWMTPSVTSLTGDWEIITPDQVLNGE